MIRRRKVKRVSDIDFDELDKAVNSLMGNVGKDRTDDGPKENTFTVSSTLKPGEKPEYEKLGEVAKTIGSETLVGRGELTIVEELDSKVKSVSSETKEDLEPKSEATEPVVMSTAPIVLAKESESALPKPIVPAVKRPASGRFMDVVHPSSDMKSSSTPALVESSRNETVTEAIKPVPVKSVVPSVDPAPLTPFLPDAKVEKRPLGEAAPTGSGAPFKDDIGATDKNESADKGDTPSNEITGVEDKKDYDNQKPIDATAIVETLSDEEKQLQALESSGEELSQGPTISAVESGDTENLTKNGDQKPADETAGDIYDVKGDHQPLAHPAKQKSGWGTVIIIILVILVFAALAGAAYFIFGFGI